MKPVKLSDVHWAWEIVLGSHNRAERDERPNKYDPSNHSITDTLVKLELCRVSGGKVYMTDKGRSHLVASVLTR